MNVEELDKRIADLRAAQKWIEVNLDLLRTTIQGLEVQRHTIAAIHSLSSIPDRPPPTPDPTTPQAPVESSAATAAGQWLGYLQDQFSRVAGAAVGTPVGTAAGTPTPPSASRKAPARKKAKTARKRRAPPG